MMNIHNILNYTNMAFINENEQGAGRWSQCSMSIRPNVYKIAGGHSFQKYFFPDCKIIPQ